MKQLIKEGTPTNLFFDNDATIEEIVDWLSVNLHTGNNVLDLNEPHSVNVEIYKPEILINGDEDLVSITIKEIKPIKL